LLSELYDVEKVLSSRSYDKMCKDMESGSRRMIKGFQRSQFPIKKAFVEFLRSYNTYKKSQPLKVDLSEWLRNEATKSDWKNFRSALIYYSIFLR